MRYGKLAALALGATAALGLVACGSTHGKTDTITLTEPGGSLALNVGGNVQGTITGAIVGGTGEYAGGTGTFTSTQTGGDNGPMTDVYKVTLP